MINDMKQQFDDGLQRTIENQVKLSELNVQFANEVALRSNSYLTELFTAGAETGRSLTECKTPMQVIEKQQEFAANCQSKAESYVKANVEALTALNKTVTELFSAFVPTAAAPAPAPRRKTKAAE
ncbi:phasin family protein [Ferrimonas pelagia]|uniref:Phasin domain-containing protein n=1 Tax=Ferrimonas pelagia TaxID=1177826 RepID=A0ABP9F4T1_9GAMM